MFQLFLYISILLIAFCFVIKDRKYVIYFSMFSLSFWGLKLAGLDLSKMSVLLVTFFVLINIKKIKLPVFYWILLSFAALMWLLPLFVGFHNFDDIVQYEYDYAFLQVPEYRVIIQFVQRIMYISLFLLPFAFNVQQRPELFYLGLKGYITGTTLQCILGLYQVFAMKINLPVWPYAQGDMQFVSGLVRLNAFAGEPRHFAIFILPSLCFLLFSLFFSEKYIFKRKKMIYLSLLHLISLFLTFSATGVFLFVFLCLLGIVLFVRVKNFAKLIFAIVFLSLITTMFYSLSNKNTLDDRVFNRLAVSYYQRSEYSTYAVFELYNKKPWLFVTGVGVGLPTYLLKEMPSYDNAYINNPRLDRSTVRDPAGFSLIITESGIIGLMFILWGGYYLLKKIRTKNDYDISLRAFFLMCIYCTGLISYGPLSPLFIGFLGLFLIQNRKLRKTF